MSTESAVKGAIGFFLIILIGTLAAACVGGIFAALVAFISRDFVIGLFSLKAGTGVIRYATAVGMIWGVFIGAAVSSFVCFLAAIIKILRIRFEHRKEPAAGK